MNVKIANKKTLKAYFLGFVLYSFVYFLPVFLIEFEYSHVIGAFIGILVYSVILWESEAIKNKPFAVIMVFVVAIPFFASVLIDSFHVEDGKWFFVGLIMSYIYCLIYDHFFNGYK